MATFFGEVMTPVSRAFWNGVEDIDDEDEDMSDARRPVYAFGETNPVIDDSYSLMLFATDRFCSDYSHSFLMSGDSKVITEINELNEKSSDELMKKKPQSSVATLYKLKNDMLLLACKSKIPLEYANDLLLMVAPWLDKSKEAVVLASKPVEEFISSSKGIGENAFVRILKTKSYKENIPCKTLEVPNAVSGFPAAMMTWCQIHERPCILSVYYYANSLPLVNTVDVTPLRKHLQSFQWYQQLENEKSNLTSIALYSHVFENSNMYL